MHLKKLILILTILIVWFVPFPVFCKKTNPPKDAESFYQKLHPSEKVTYLGYLILSGRESEAFEKINQLKNSKLDLKFKNRLQFMQGYLNLTNGKPAEAYNIFSELQGKYSEIEPALTYWTARSARLKGDPKKALEILEVGCQGACEPSLITTHETTVVAKKKGSRKRVQKITKSKTVLAKESYRMAREYASALCESGEKSKSDEMFKKLIEYDPESLSQELTRLDLIRCKMKNHEADDAYSELRISFTKARARVSKTRYEELLKSLHQEKSNIPNQFSLEDRVARISTLKLLDRWVEAAKEYKEILPQLKSSSMEIGDTFFKARFYKDAAQAYETVLKEKLENEERTSMDEKLASAYARSNQFDKAIQILKRISSDSDAKRNYKIAFLLVDAGHYQEAIDRLDKFIQQFPRSDKREEASWLKAWSYYRLRKMNEAADQFLAIQQEYPRSAEARKARYWRERALGSIGNKEIAFSAQGSGETFYEKWDSRQKNGQSCPTIDPKNSKSKTDFFAVDSVLTDLPTEEATHLRELLSVGLWEDFFQRYQTVQSKSDLNWREGSNTLNSWVHFFTTVDELPAALAYGVIREESHFNPLARSPVGAVGLMQIMPQTGYEIAESLHLDSYSNNDLGNPLVNVRFGVDYLSTLQKRFKGNLVYTISSYNAGPEATERWIDQRKGYPCDEFIEEIPYKETHYYVKKVMQSFWNYQENPNFSFLTK